MLIGRSTECARIEALIDAARCGSGGALVLRGEPGVGKTALLHEARDRAYDMLVLTAQGVETESELPFAGLSQLLGPVVGRAVALPLPQRRALEVALGFGGARPGEPFAAYVAALALLAQVAETRPVLAVVDDAHWLDTASAEALAFAARRLGAEPIAMLFAVRTRGMEGAQLPQAAVDGLDDASFAALVGSLTDVEPPPAVHRRLHRDTGGNPLAIIELAATLSDRQLTGAEPLPEPLPAGSALERSFGERLDALPDAVRRALVIAAADEQRETGLLTRALRLRGLALPDLAPAEAEGHVTIAGGRLDFRHPLLRSAAYYGAPPPARRDAHAALAAALDGDPRERARRAFHRAAASAGPDEDAARELDAVAADALSRPAPVAAAHAFAAAARLSADDATRMPRLIEAARAFYVGGALTQSLETLDAALPLTDDPCVRADLQRLRAQCLALRIPPGETLALLLDEAERVQPFDAARAAILQLDACHAAIMTGEPREALRLAQLAWPVARADGGTLRLAARSCSAPRWCSRRGGTGRRAPARGAPAPRDGRAVADGLVRRADRQSEVWLERYEDGPAAPRLDRAHPCGGGADRAAACAPGARLTRSSTWAIGRRRAHTRTRPWSSRPSSISSMRSSRSSPSACSTARRAGSTARAAGSRRRTAWASAPTSDRRARWPAGPAGSSS